MKKSVRTLTTPFRVRVEFDYQDQTWWLEESAAGSFWVEPEDARGVADRLEETLRECVPKLAEARERLEAPLAKARETLTVEWELDAEVDAVLMGRRSSPTSLAHSLALRQRHAAQDEELLQRRRGMLRRYRSAVREAVETTVDCEDPVLLEELAVQAAVRFGT